MLILLYLLCFLIAVLLIPVTIFLLQVVAACFAKSSTTSLGSKARPSIAILMPAHNESLVIAQALASIKPCLESQDQLIVIADNCTDDTATIALAEGATVLERFNPRERGKGYALDFGLQHLKANHAPDVVIIIDADCMVQDNAITLLASSCMQLERPIQALYLMESQPAPSLKSRVASFAWQVKNKVRPLGFKVLGLPCQLMGTGMAFMWGDISRVSLASGHIVEDMKLGTDLARLNKAPLFLQEAVVTSIFPPSEAATNSQRARWEHGHLSVILSEVPKLIFNAIRSKNMQMLGLACDLLIPPLAMLALMCLVVLGLSILLGNYMVMLAAAALFGGLLLTVLLAWVKFGRDIISFKQLCYAPVYALVKIPLYLKFFVNRQVEWVRSKRD